MPPGAAAQEAASEEQDAAHGDRAMDDRQQDSDDQHHQPAPRVAWLSSPHGSLETQLYTSHLLSTCNSRAFEFAAVLFLAALFPSTLRPLSVYALARSAAAVLLAQPVGAAIDARDRLAVVRASIVAGRAAAAGSCALFWALGLGAQGAARDGLFAALCVLACVEKLASVANMVAVERDWVVVMTEGDENWRRGERRRRLLYSGRSLGRSASCC